jgi:4-amino-4-deoxy-L-arabinose transferase-like glycosyltransferase
MSPWAAPRRALTLLALWLLATLGLRPLLLPDEGRYADVARQMLLHDDGFTPLLNGLPFLHKPPLMYWLDMAAMAALGVHQFSARFAPFVGAWVMGAALFFAARRWHGTQAAGVALLALATCPFFFVGSQYANLDMLVAGMLSATVLAFVRAVDGEAVSRRWVVGAWILAALSVLAKGLIGVLLPALIVGPWLLAQGRWRDVLRLLHPLGLLAFALVGLPWFLLMQQRYPGFFDYFVIEQHFRRFAQSNFNNVHPGWFYLLVLPALTLPWSMWLPIAIGRVRRERHGDNHWRLALCLWWIVVVVGFFSLPSSKLVGYVLPALAPWCMLLGYAASHWPRRFIATAAVGALAGLVIVGVLAWQAPKSSKAAARVLAREMIAGDRVVFVDEMFYDLPFYAGLTQPVVVASDWKNPELPLRDNWRKELFDAARFDPARAAQLLWPIDRLEELRCHSQAVWFVVLPHRVSRLSGWTDVEKVHADREVVLLRSPARRC